jgi:hypothetical protein
MKHDILGYVFAFFGRMEWRREAPEFTKGVDVSKLD